MSSASLAGSPSDDWESLPGWTPVYVGLGRFRVGLALRLVVVALAPLATALALEHGPAAFLLTVMVTSPALAVVTSALMVSGLTAYAHPPRQTEADQLTRAAKHAFSLLLGVDLGHLVVAVVVALQVSESASIGWLLGLQIASYVLGLLCLFVLILSLQRIATFVGAMPALARLRHLRLGLIVLVPALLGSYFADDALHGLGTGWPLVVTTLLLAGAVLVIAGVLQVVTSLRENLFLTTSEFAVVSVTGEHRALPEGSARKKPKR